MQHKIAIAVALIIKDNEHFLCNKISSFCNNSLDLYIFDFDTFNEQITELSEESFEEMVSAVFMSVKSEDESIVMVLHKKYLDISDFNINEENKAFVWILMNMYRLIINRFCDVAIEDDNALVAKDARSFVEMITGFKSSTFKNEKWIIKDLEVFTKLAQA